MLSKLFSIIGAISCIAAAEPFEVKTLEIGAAAPDFKLKGVDDKEHALADFSQAKVLAVMFTCNHCPEALAAAPRMEELFQQYKDKSVAIVAISGNDPLALREDEKGYGVYGDSFDEMKIHAKEFHWSFPYLYDGDTETVTKAYGAVSTPHVFVFDSERKLRYTGRMDEGYRKSGPVEKSQIKDAIDAILAGQEVAVKTTRSYGCSTKWSFKRDSVKADDEAWLKREITLDELTVEKAKALMENKTDKVRLINFWATTCGPCIAELPELITTGRRFQNRPFEFITISTDPTENKNRVTALLKGKHAALPKTLEESLKNEGRISNNYQIADGALDDVSDLIDKEWKGDLPHSVLVAPGGKVLWKHDGEVDINEVRREIIKALEGK